MEFKNLRAQCSRPKRKRDEMIPFMDFQAFFPKDKNNTYYILHLADLLIGLFQNFGHWPWSKEGAIV